MPLGIMPGEWDWMFQRDPFGRAAQYPNVPGFPGGGRGGLLGGEQPSGILGRVNKALEPYGGMGGLGARLLANSGRANSFGEALGTSMLGGQEQVQSQQNDALRREYMQAQIERMRQPAPQRPPERVDLGDAIGILDEAGNVVLKIPKGATPESAATREAALAERDTARTFQRAQQEDAQAFQAEQARIAREATTAQAQTARSAATQTKEKDKLQVWNTYKQAREGLLSGLAGTETGPFAGRIPAVTTAQQIGEGAFAAMGPVLKQLFRVAGEGVFTDRDQALLLQMIPDRRDTPEARKAKIENIDRIVQAKLGIGGTGTGGTQKRVRVDAQGNVIGN